MAGRWSYCVYRDRAFLSIQSQTCDYADCGSHRHNSSMPGISEWEEVRELNQYPEIPLTGERYPLILQ